MFSQQSPSLQLFLHDEGVHEVSFHLRIESMEIANHYSRYRGKFWKDVRMFLKKRYPDFLIEIDCRDDEFEFHFIYVHLPLATWEETARTMLNELDEEWEKDWSIVLRDPETLKELIVNKLSERAFLVDALLHATKQYDIDIIKTILTKHYVI
jgi:hypothetical protein